MKMTQKEAQKIVVGFTVVMLEDHGPGLLHVNEPVDKRWRMVKAFLMMGMDKHNIHGLAQSLDVPSEAVDVMMKERK